jgi:hypothetical protein
MVLRPVNPEMDKKVHLQKLQLYLVKHRKQPTTGKLGGAGLAAQNSYITSLFDPASQAEAKIQILGDPDFIMTDSGYSEEQLYKKFYGADGFTINPNGGQVFVEIDFKEAVDYSSDGASLLHRPSRRNNRRTRHIIY